MFWQFQRLEGTKFAGWGYQNRRLKLVSSVNWGYQIRRLGVPDSQVADLEFQDSQVGGFLVALLVALLVARLVALLVALLAAHPKTRSGAP